MENIKKIEKKQIDIVAHLLLDDTLCYSALARMHKPCMVRFDRTIPAPASPKPTRSKEEIFSRELSKSLISYSPMHAQQVNQKS